MIAGIELIARINNPPIPMLTTAIPTNRATGGLSYFTFSVNSRSMIKR